MKNGNEAFLFRVAPFTCFHSLSFSLFPLLFLPSSTFCVLYYSNFTYVWETGIFDEADSRRRLKRARLGDSLFHSVSKSTGICNWNFCGTINRPRTNLNFTMTDPRWWFPQLFPPIFFFLPNVYFAWSWKAACSFYMLLIATECAGIFFLCFYTYIYIYGLKSKKMPQKNKTWIREKVKVIKENYIRM